MIIFLISKNFGVFHNCLSCMEYISVVLFYHTRIINYNYFGVFSICSLISVSLSAGFLVEVGASLSQYSSSGDS